ncbi:MAG: hypothetical protein CL693_07005 [Cellvibrionaceae bacterium]|nr:hypothetical protein [Cellvibrionaceae bacterium]|tara:strand:+ start:343 stop:615 length:273 start_codon:yes stop_codon:yes gene_type:complete
MSPTLTLLLKTGLVLFYALVPLSFLVEPLSSHQTLLLYVALALAVAHVGEYLLLKTKLQKLPGERHFLYTLLFGFLHWLPLMQAQKSAQG